MVVLLWKTIGLRSSRERFRVSLGGENVSFTKENLRFMELQGEV